MKLNKFILIIILILLCIILSVSYIKNSFINFMENIKKCEYDHIILNNKELSDLEDLLLEFKRYSDENNIPYFLIGGTLIGTVRHGGLMPLDDDIDVGILAKDSNLFQTYKNEHYYTEAMYDPFNFGFKLYKKVYKSSKKMFIDILVFEEKNGMLRIINDLWPNEAIEVNKLFPLVNAKYNDIDVTIPNKYIEYLNKVFPKWDTVIKPACEHLPSEKGKCTFRDVHNLPDEIPIEENNKFLCYSAFPVNQ